MIQPNAQEEVTITDSPQVIRKTTTSTEPQAKGGAPQKVYETKKTIFRFNQIIWYILGLIEVLLIFRVVLKALGANQFVGFTSLVYSLTNPLAAPFAGILGVSTTGNSLIEWSTVIAAVVYICVAWGLVYLLDLIYPISPKDVETQ
ncbi:MAG TPA: YggT family protein [Candidatus Eisenbacteria bacterium]|nr:YggT family protein [Candidatus Eisenbacteria bacterium]